MKSVKFLVFGSMLFFLVSILMRVSAQESGPAQPGRLISETAETSFSYQGLLQDNGVPANGSYDFQFYLHDALIGGTQIAGPKDIDDVNVTDGLFNVVLDFGPDIFTGNVLYLEVRVKPGASPGTYEPLTPRQSLLPSPMTIAGHNFLNAQDGSPTNAVFVNNDGDVGIGTVGPDDARLQVVAPNSEVDVAIFESGHPNGAVIWLDSTASGGRTFKLLSTANGASQGPGKFLILDIDASAYRFAIDSVGNVGIGTTSPTVKFQVGADGDGSTTLANFWGTFSNPNHMRDINPIENSIETLQDIEGVQFTWIDSGEPSIGFIADNIERVVPEMVHTDDEGYKSVDYSRLTPILVEAAKEQQTQIEALQKENQELSQEIEEIKRILAENGAAVSSSDTNWLPIGLVVFLSGFVVLKRKEQFKFGG